MDAAGLLHRVQIDLVAHSEPYGLYIKAATIAVLFYVGLTDFRTFRISNETIVLLLLLYVAYALVARSGIEIASNVVVAAIMFGALLLLYARGALGGGDVKLLATASLWVGIHCALPFSVFLLLLVGLHVLAVKIGWAPVQTIAGRQAIPYAPSIAGALIGVIVIGCV
jgi:Flp pilus assembly protein protease CpaA